MSDIGDAFGTVAEGGLFARVFGKAQGADGSVTKLDHGHFAEDACLNCGEPLQGPHCHACGQKAHLHRTLGAFLHDLLHGALHLDGKTWRTLPKLFFKPGELTRQYIEGKRARFVSPMAMFLFSIFLMFGVFQVVGLTPPTDIRTKDAIEEDMVEAYAEKEKTVVEQRERVAAMSPDNPRLGDATSRLEEYEKELSDLDAARTIIVGSDSGARMTIGKTGVDWIDRGLDKWRTNPGLMLYKLQANSYKFSWLLIPLSLPFVWLLFFWKRRFRAYDHAIFVTYSITFMSLLFVTASILAATVLPIWLVVVGALLIAPIHLYKHLRYTYDLSRFSTVWRLAILLLFINIVIGIFLQMLLILGAF